MGLFSSSQRQTKTTTPNVPDWLAGPAQDIVAKRTALGSVAPTDYVARTNPLLDAATNATSQLKTSPNYGVATDLATGASDLSWLTPLMNADSPDLLSGISKFQSPYTRDVVDAALADFDFGAGQTRAQQDLDLAGSGAFGGSGAALTKSATEDALARGRGATSANLRDQGFSRAADLAIQDANLSMADRDQKARFGFGGGTQSLNAAGMLGDIAGAQGAETRANTQQQIDMGQIIRQIEQEMRNAPLNLVDWQSQIADLIGPFSGETSTGTSSGGGSALDKAGKVAAIAGTVAKIFSDERLKTDVVKLGVRSDGLGVYLYRYLWSPARFIGVMAQEVLKVKPSAVHRDRSGFLMVDYGAL